MKDYSFNQCREFLEQQIKSCDEQSERDKLLQSYQKLFELKSEYDKETDKAVIEKEIRKAEFQAQTQQNWQNNDAETRQNWDTQQANMNGHYYSAQTSTFNALAPHIPGLMNNGR